MPKSKRSTLVPVYEAAQEFVSRALAADDSVLTPGEQIWRLDHVEEFYRLFVEQEDTSKDSFNVKLLRQIEGASKETAQLAAELMFFHSLGINNQGPVSKRAMFEPLLERADTQFPDRYEAALQDGVVSFGAGLAHRDAYIRLLGRFFLQWKSLPSGEAGYLLGDPAAFGDFVFDLPRGADAAQRNMLVHLIFPESFEPIASPYVKSAIVDTFSEFTTDPDAAIDAQLAEIRQALAGKYGAGFGFYDDELETQWGNVENASAAAFTDPVAAIAEMMTAIYPDDEFRVLLMNLAADTIDEAHATRAASWGVGPGAKHTHLAVNVGRLATLGFSKDGVLASLDDEMVDEVLRAQLDEASVGESGRFESMPSARYWRLRSDAVPALIDQIREPLASHTRRAALAVASTPYARFHSSAAIEYLSAETGRDLPEPEGPVLPSVHGATGWDGFVAWAARMYDDDRFDDWERDYKLAIGTRLQVAREALAEGGDWWPKLKTAFTKDNNLTPWQQHSKFYEWAREEPDAAGIALSAIWDEAEDVATRISSFTDRLPRDVVGGVGTRLAIASFLLMVDPTTNPIFRPTPFNVAWRLTGWEPPASSADEAETYEVALAFMDELRTRLETAGVQVRDRLDAQGLIWSVVHWNEPPQFLTPEEQRALKLFRDGHVESTPATTATVEKEPATTSDGYKEPTFDEVLDHFATAGFRIEPTTLLRYHLSLKTRGFVILSGVSGTGKSWLTRLYASAVGGEVRLVPVAPNWTTNEDLLGFHNPITGAYVDTDFSRFLRVAAAEQAKADEEGVDPRPYFVVLDEMNLARIEYYFAKFLSVMEARTEEGVAIELSPSERLALPKNLYAVGTVNVDETTHGFADKVYDRAQVVELPITEEDVATHIGNALYASSLMAVWRAVQAVAPFAYRVVDEVGAYVLTAMDAGLGWEEALDHQVLQKVLPKLARADDRVGEALLQIQDACAESMPLSAAKAAAMHHNLEQHGFASYF